MPDCQADQAGSAQPPPPGLDDMRSLFLLAGRWWFKQHANSPIDLAVGGRGFWRAPHGARRTSQRWRPGVPRPLAAFDHGEWFVRRLGWWIPASAPAARRPRQQTTLCALGAVPLQIAAPKLFGSGASRAAGPVLAGVQIISIARAIVHVQPLQQSTEGAHVRAGQLVEQRAADRR